MVSKVEPSRTMTQKVLKVGSSAAVVIPKQSLKELGWKIGDRVFVYVDLVQQKIVIVKKKIRLLI